MGIKTIHENILAKLCGYNARTLRSWGSDGHIPKPKNGEYPFTETIMAMFRYLRENKPQSVYDSMEQCEAMTGLPKSTQQWAKSIGCPAFRDSRVYFLEFFKWLMIEQRGADATNWNGVGMEMDAKLKMIKVGVELRDLIHKDEVAECMQAFAGICFNALKRMTLEFPRSLEQRSRGFIKTALAEVYEQELARATAELEKLKKESETVKK